VDEWLLEPLLVDQVGAGVHQVGVVFGGPVLTDRGDHLEGGENRMGGIGRLVGGRLVPQLGEETVLVLRIFAEDAHRVVEGVAVEGEDPIVGEQLAVGPGLGRRLTDVDTGHQGRGRARRLRLGDDGDPGRGGRGRRGCGLLDGGGGGGVAGSTRPAAAAADGGAEDEQEDEGADQGAIRGKPDR
jgi:hypothetical protein